jgi:hypothetical protein
MRDTTRYDAVPSLPERLTASHPVFEAIVLRRTYGETGLDLVFAIQYDSSSLPVAEPVAVVFYKFAVPHSVGELG